MYAHTRTPQLFLRNPLTDGWAPGWPVVCHAGGEGKLQPSNLTRINPYNRAALGLIPFWWPFSHSHPSSFDLHKVNWLSERRKGRKENAGKKMEEDEEEVGNFPYSWLQSE